MSDELDGEAAPDGDDGSARALKEGLLPMRVMSLMGKPPQMGMMGVRVRSKMATYLCE